MRPKLEWDDTGQFRPAADKDSGLPEAAPSFLNWQAALPVLPAQQGLVSSPGVAFGEESEGIKEAWAWPKLKVAVSFLKHLETRLGQAPDGGMAGDSGPVKAAPGRSVSTERSWAACLVRLLWGSGQESPETLTQGSRDLGTELD